VNPVTASCFISSVSHGVTLNFTPKAGNELTIISECTTCYFYEVEKAAMSTSSNSAQT